MFGHELESCIYECMCLLREVFDELVRNCVRAVRLTGWGAVDCFVIMALCDVFIEGLCWVWLMGDKDGGMMVKLSGLWGCVHGASGRCFGVNLFCSCS